MDQKQLERGIMATMAYFSIFDYPPTLYELWKWLYLSNYQKKGQHHQIPPSEVSYLLENSALLSKYVHTKRGFYFLRDQDNQIQKRTQRYNLADAKYRIARRFTHLIKLFPGVKMVAICNSLAYNNAHQQSDIDLFIISQKNRIWTTRFATTFLAKLLGIRPQGKNTTNKICLSFYIDESHLDLTSIKVKPDDIYLIYWINQIVPLFDSINIYPRFIQANRWTNQYLPNITPKQPVWRRQINLGKTGKIIRSLSKIFLVNPWGNYIEKLCQSFQMKIMPPTLKEAASENKGVILGDKIIKLHGQDERREKYYELWRGKLKELSE